MDAQWLLIDRLFYLETAYARFLESLDQRRTVTLGQLMTMEHGLPAGVKPDWLSLCTLSQRMTQLAKFLDRAHGCGLARAWDDLPLVFLQTSVHEEDETEHTRRIADEPEYANAYKRLPPDTSYLLGATRISETLVGTNGGAIVPALTRFQRASKTTRLLGYRLPHYPSLLGVSDRTATHYLARMIGNDICALVLPTGGCDRPHLHNATTLNAMRVPKEKCATQWEQMIFNECTDPMFFIDAPTRVSPADAGQDSLRRHIMNRVRAEYVVNWPERTKNLCADVDARSKVRKASVQAVLDAMLKDGYRRFAAAQERERL